MATEDATAKAPAAAAPPEQPVYAYPFASPAAGATYPPPFFTFPPPTDAAHSESNGAPPSGPYMVPYPGPPGGLFYTFPPAGFQPPPGQQPQAPVPTSPGPRPKRSQVKMACTNCAVACKRCDEKRPCTRCVKYSLADKCVDGQRKERKKGIKRGPYKRRPREGDSPPGSFAADAGDGVAPAVAPAEWTNANGTPASAPTPATTVAPTATISSTSATATALSPAPASGAPPASMPVPHPFPVLPEGYQHTFYPPMGFVFAPPPGAEEGAQPVHYLLPYTPFGVYPTMAAPPGASATLPSALVPVGVAVPPGSAHPVPVPVTVANAKKVSAENKDKPGTPKTNGDVAPIAAVSSTVGVVNNLNGANGASTTAAVATETSINDQDLADEDADADGEDA
ncbi:hypothetical protein R3P38DRAFT_3310935 [Favolaschia claudopus]|uniref:Zn(2)-C6 fungal-type domain-containing protein n=1 Tax=Favolaschia claudopus TaxID=2862362 RepID=A0AAW0CL04_9AGAR